MTRMLGRGALWGQLQPIHPVQGLKAWIVSEKSLYHSLRDSNLNSFRRKPHDWAVRAPNRRHGIPTAKAGIPINRIGPTWASPHTPAEMEANATSITQATPTKLNKKPITRATTFMAQ